MSNEPPSNEHELYDLVNQALTANSDESENAIAALARIDNPEHRDFIFEILKISLSTSSDELKVRGLRILATFGDSAKGCLPEIRPLLNDPRVSVAAVAAFAICKIEGSPPTIEPILQSILSENEIDRQFGFWIVSQIGLELGSMLPNLSQSLIDSEGPERLSVATALLRIASDGFKSGRVEIATEAFQPLQRLPDAQLRRSAYQAITDLPPSRELVQLIVQGLSDDSPGVRTVSAFSLGRFQDFRDQARDALFRCLKDGDLEVRGGSAISLTLLQLQDNAVVATLSEVVNNAEGELKSIASDVFHMVMSSAVDRSFDRAKQIDELGETLSRDGGDAEVNRLVEILRDSSVDFRERAEAAQLLQHIGPRAAVAAPTLKQLFESREHYYIRTRAFDALMVIAVDDPKSLPIAISALSDEQEIVRFRAAFVLRTLGKDSSEALQALQRATQDSSQIVREAATESVRQLSSGSSNSNGRKPWWKFW